MNIEEFLTPKRLYLSSRGLRDYLEEVNDFCGIATTTLNKGRAHENEPRLAVRR